MSETASTTAIPTMDMGRRARTPAEEKANAPGRARTSRYGWSIRPLSQCRPTSGHRIGPRAGDDLGREQGEQDAVLVGGPHGAVLTQERRAGGLLAAEAHRAVQQAGHEPLEPDRHLEQAPAVVRGHPVLSLI